MKTSHSSQGFVLIEVLVALLIFAFGMLGLLAFQANAAKLTTESQFRTDAASLVDELIGQMRVASPDSLKTDFAVGGDKTKAWVDNRLEDSLGSNAAVDTLTITDGLVGDTFVVDIVISWEAPGSPNGGMSYATSALIF